MNLQDIRILSISDDLQSVLMQCAEITYDGKWPRTITAGGHTYIFLEKVPPISGAPFRLGKYSLAQIITLVEQEEMLKPIPAGAHDKLITLPYGLEFQTGFLAQRSKTRHVGHQHSPASFTEILKYAQKIASDLGINPDDLQTNVNYAQIQYFIVERESDEDYAERINAARKGIIEKYFASLRDASLAEKDQLASDKRAYQQLLRLQEKFASRTPEQLEELKNKDE